jgi:hypothetical protein
MKTFAYSVLSECRRAAIPIIKSNKEIDKKKIFLHEADFYFTFRCDFEL